MENFVYYFRLVLALVATASNYVFLYIAWIDQNGFYSGMFAIVVYLVWVLQKRIDLFKKSQKSGYGRD